MKTESPSYSSDYRIQGKQAGLTEEGDIGVVDLKGGNAGLAKILLSNSDPR
jgi:hypothetical protein